MSEIAWKRYKHLPEGAIHGFSPPDETIAACGRDDLPNAIQWVLVEKTEAIKDKEMDELFYKLKCKNCVRVLKEIKPFIIKPKTENKGQMPEIQPFS